MRKGYNEYYRDKNGKISEKRLSPYGRQQLRLLQGAKLYFSDVGVLTVKGNKIISENGKVFAIINNDRLVNKIVFKTM